VAIAQSRLTAQGQISIPAEVRKKLGVGPEPVLEWEQRDAEIVVRRAGKHTSSQVPAALFSADWPVPDVSVKQGIRDYVRKKHARAQPALGFPDALVLAIARKARHVPLGTFDKNLARVEGTQRL